MAKSAESSSSFIAQVSFLGRQGGAVKSLRGFKKTHHTLPDAVNSATSAFLAKLCADELTEEAEAFFQRVRGAFNYKRKDLSLEVTSPTAALVARDFTLEVGYELEAGNASYYVVTKRLHSVRNGDMVLLPEFDSVFAGLFSEIVFALAKGAPVEAVIDAVEALENDDGLRVDYPSDHRDCTLVIEGVSAEVKFDGTELRIVFPRQGSPRELFEAFATVRRAFMLTKSKALAGIFG